MQAAACLHLLRIALVRRDAATAGKLRDLCGEFEPLLFSLPLYKRELVDLQRRLSTEIR